MTQLFQAIALSASPLRQPAPISSAPVTANKTHSTMSLNAYFESKKPNPFSSLSRTYATVSIQTLTHPPVPPEKVCIITTDGRNLVGTLAAHDYTTNLVRPAPKPEYVHTQRLTSCDDVRSSKTQLSA